MFSEEDRARRRVELIATAEADEAITAAALVGSAARGAEDRWSDIDLALRLAEGHEPADVAERWAEHLYARHNAAAHLDIWSGPALYRVFVLRDTLQVDLSFWPDRAFAPVGGPFHLLFGEANPAATTQPRDPATVIGMAWLYALHARSSIARERRLQALHLLNGLRDHVITLACLRAGLPEEQGRGVDDLPADQRGRLTDTLVRSMETPELVRAFALLLDLLAREAEATDPRTAGAVAPVLTDLAGSVTDSPASAG